MCVKAVLGALDVLGAFFQCASCARARRADNREFAPNAPNAPKVRNLLGRGFEHEFRAWPCQSPCSIRRASSRVLALHGGLPAPGGYLERHQGINLYLESVALSVADAPSLGRLFQCNKGINLYSCYIAAKGRPRLPVNRPLREDRTLALVQVPMLQVQRFKE